MTIMAKVKICSSFLLIILVAGMLCACGSPAPEVPPTSDTSSTAADKVEVIYFHRPRRCVTCLCFEERIRHVVKTYFQDEMNSGKLTFEVIDIGDERNTAIVNKYGAISSQLFINSVKDGVDHIRDIQEIWSWDCRSDAEGFEQKVKNTIELSLKYEE